jgi:hypothetical protein
MGQHIKSFEVFTDLGLSNGMAQGTSVLTLDGDIPVEFLNIGDKVLTHSGIRLLKSIEVSVVKNAGMVRVGASTLGHERPKEDVLVSASQKILVRDWRAVAFAGTKQALIPAAKLADGEFIRGETIETARIFSLHFEDDVVIYAGGLELACSAASVTALSPVKASV